MSGLGLKKKKTLTWSDQINVIPPLLPSETQTEKEEEKKEVVESPEDKLKKDVQRFVQFCDAQADRIKNILKLTMACGELVEKQEKLTRIMLYVSSKKENLAYELLWNEKYLDGLLSVLSLKELSINNSRALQDMLEEKLFETKKFDSLIDHFPNFEDEIKEIRDGMNEIEKLEHKIPEEKRCFDDVKKAEEELKQLWIQEKIEYTRGLDLAVKNIYTEEVEAMEKRRSAFSEEFQESMDTCLESAKHIFCAKEQDEKLNKMVSDLAVEYGFKKNDLSFLLNEFRRMYEMLPVMYVQDWLFNEYLGEEKLPDFLLDLHSKDDVKNSPIASPAEKKLSTTVVHDSEPEEEEYEMPIYDRSCRIL